MYLDFPGGRHLSLGKEFPEITTLVPSLEMCCRFKKLPLDSHCACSESISVKLTGRK